ncbi:MAG TPA: translocation/assembly module TamB domain-containing protein [Candidatus Sulfotelmatobacter sp.]|nr:translocation/assembly module TamB domain-containing protein [Candidatus Sulfotelmatobacter sp.]
MSKRQRRWVLGLGIFMAGFILLWAALPLWFPWVLRPLARQGGAHYGHYHREGYARFALDNVSFTNRSTRGQAQRLEAFVPTAWLWHWAIRPSREPFVQVNGWEYVSLPGNPSGRSTAATVQQWTEALQRLKSWVPLAMLSNGIVRVRDTPFNAPTLQRFNAPTSVPVPALTWHHGELRAQLELPRFNALTLQRFNAPTSVPVPTLTVRLVPARPYEVQVASEPLHLYSTVTLSTNVPGFGLQGTGEWWSNHITFQAQFGPAGDWPQTARVQAPAVRLPAAVLHLGHYGDIQGAGSVQWENDHFAVDLRAGAQPLAVQTNWPPLQLDLHARGDTNRATIESAVISSPWLKAELSREVQVHFTGPLLRAPATLRLAADLSRLPWWISLPRPIARGEGRGEQLQGHLNGEADFQPAIGKYPIARFQLSGTNIGPQQLQAKTLSLRGNLDWPWLQLTESEARFEDGSSAAASGKLDWEHKALADAHFQFNGPLIRRWLPAGYSYQGLTVSGTAHGPLEALRHSAHVEVAGFSSPRLQPLALRADWSGQQLNFERAEVVAFTGLGRLRAQGALEVGRSGANLLVQTLTLSQGGPAVLALEQPARLSLGRAGAAGGPWSGRLEAFHWQGSAGDVQLQGAVVWPRTGRLEASLQNLHSEVLDSFLKSTPAPITIQNLGLRAGWTNSPIQFSLELTASAVTNLALSAELQLTGNQQGIRLEKLVFQAATPGGRPEGSASLPFNASTAVPVPVATARGFLPVTLEPGAATGLVQPHPDGPLELKAVAQPHAFFWNQLAEWSGVRLQEPNLNVELGGTWQEPRGQIKLQAQQLRLRNAKPTFPGLAALEMEVELDRERARLSNGRLLVQGQPVTLTGELPLGAGFWAGLKEKRLPDWQQASARLRMEEADLAAFAELFPKVLSPQGELNLDLALRPGAKLEGELTVHRARTRPVGNTGPVRDIEVKLRCQDRTLRLESATANIGGAPVAIAGQADLQGTNWLHGALPPFMVTLNGLSVPLARQPEFIIRGDLNLVVAKTNDAPPWISGGVTLRDSFYLSDLRALIPGKVATPRLRPPYFSVEEPGLADWRLAMQVQGEKFLTVRSPIFNGQISTQLKLQGTLKDPIALGDVTINSGVVRFPFASLQVQQGLVTLTSQDPYRPQLAVTATSKQFGYDIRMEASGPVDAPILQFNSTPPLGSEQILLMVTAGELPRGEYSLSSQQKAQTMALFLGRDVLAKLGLGDQAEQRLIIHSGEQISEQGRPTYNVEYKLSDDWSVVGEYDRFGDFNAGVKWRVYSK